jgi:hypothetical protein
VGGIESGSRPVAGFHISGFEPSRFAIRVRTHTYISILSKINI